MPRVNCYCIVCGLPIVHNEIKYRYADSATAWLGEFRAIYSVDKDSFSALLSGPVQNGANVFEPYESEKGSKSAEKKIEIALMYVALKPDDERFIAVPAWGFPIHCACWELILALHRGGQPNIQRLFELLLSSPLNLGASNFGHDYGGVMSFFTTGRKSSHDENYLAPSIFEGEQNVKDPFHIPELAQLFQENADRLEPPNTHRDNEVGSATSRSWRQTSNDIDPFYKLPAEILYIVLTHLPSLDVVRLKQSSRVYASIPLQDGFWRSRFNIGQEFEYVFEAEQSSAIWRGRWRLLYIWIKSLHADPLVANAMASRKRVWSLASTLLNVVHLIGDIPCAGERVCSLFEPDAPLSALPCDLRWVTASRAHEHLSFGSTIGNKGSSSFYERHLVVPSKILSIFISTVDACGERYISGLRFEYGDGKSSALGYVRSQEKEITWPIKTSRPSITGFVLAFGHRGIKGLMIRSTECLSHWVGERDLPKRNLVLMPTTIEATSRTVKFLKGRFDALRLVSMSISSGERESDPVSENTWSLADTALWFPDIPGSKYSFLGPQGSDLHVPFTMAIFDDSNNGCLQKLVLTAWVESDECILCLKASSEYAHNERKECLLGEQPSDIDNTPAPSQEEEEEDEVYEPEDWVDKIDITIDYGHGERILGMDILYNTRGFFESFKILTNWERTVCFTPERLPCWERTISLPPPDTYHPYLVSKIYSPRNERIVGFYSLFQSKRLVYFGIVCVASNSLPDMRSSEI